MTAAKGFGLNEERSFEPALDPRQTDVGAKSVCVAFALGCPRAEADTARLCEYIRANGWPIAATVEEADVVLVMTCGFNADYEEISVSLLESAERRRKAVSQLIIVGCLAGIGEERLQRTFDAVTVPPKRASELDAILGAAAPLESVPDPGGELEPYIARTSRHFTDAERHPGDSKATARVRDLLVRSGARERWLRRRGNNDQGYLGPNTRVCSIRVAAGCAGECTYCAIRLAAGSLHSKPLATVLAEFDAGLARGYKEFKLIAGDLGCYGQDQGTNVAELLTAVMARPGDFKLTLLDFHPRYLIEYQDTLVDLLASHRTRIRSILLPMQSGSERILTMMRRGHAAADAERALRALRTACPDTRLATHILVGFPGETERDFEDTLHILRVTRFNSVCVYDYQDRPQTDASRMPNKVPQTTIRSRGLRARREFGGRWDALRYRAKTLGLR